MRDISSDTDDLRGCLLLYAGSVRPGGGVAVVDTLVRRILAETEMNVRIVLGHRQAEAILKRSYEREPRVAFTLFLPTVSAAVRTLASKIRFLSWSYGAKNRSPTVLLSINFWMPSMCPSVTMHVNLLNFVSKGGDRPGKRLRDLDARIACRRSTVNAFESRYLLDTASARLGRPIRASHILYAGLDSTFTRNDVNERPEPGRLAMVSSMQPHKDNDTVLDALAMLCRDAPDIPWTLQVFGGQHERQWAPFELTAKRLGIAERVSVHGPIAKTELTLELARCVCLVSASRMESFAMVPLEAMASGCPAVTTDVSSMPESLGEAAVMVAAGDAQAMAASVTRLARDPIERSKRIAAGRQRAAAFDEVSLRGQLEQVLRTAMNASRRQVRR